MRKRIESTIILLIGLLLAYWFIRRLEWGEVIGHFREMLVWPVLLGGLLILATLFIRSLRWRVLLLPIRDVGLGPLFVSTTIGFGSVFIFGRAGEVVRPVILSLRERLPPSATIATIMVERIFDMSAVAMLFAFNLLFFDPPPTSPLDPPTLRQINSIGVLMTIGVIAGLATLILFRLRSNWVIGLIERWGGRLPHWLLATATNLIRHLADALSVLLNWRELASTILLTAVVWALVTAATWLVAYAFHLTLPLSSAIFILGFGLLGSLVPSPGGSAGAFHAAAAAGLIFLGVERNLAGSISIIFHIVAFGPPFLLGIFFLMRDGIGLHRLREIISTRGGPQAGPETGETSTD